MRRSRPPLLAATAVSSWLLCTWPGSASKQLGGEYHDLSVSAGDTSGLWPSKKVQIPVEIENDTPYEIENFMVVHRYNGMPHGEANSHVLAFQSIGPGTVSAQQEIPTMVGRMKMRDDWWFTSWSFHREGGEPCPCCTKEDGRCSTLISNPNNAFTQYLRDPMSYVKVSTFVANVALATMTLGASTGIAFSFTTAAVDILADTLKGDTSTHGFKDCMLKSEVTVRIRISPDFKPGDKVVCTEPIGDRCPLGTVGTVRGFSRQSSTAPVSASWPTADGLEEEHVFGLRDLRHAFRVGDAVHQANSLGTSEHREGEVVGYSSSGFVEVRFEDMENFEVVGHHLLEVSHTKPGKEHARPEFNVEILQYGGVHALSGMRGKDVLKKCDMKAHSLPCHVSADTTGEPVPVTVKNTGRRTIKSWSLIHKYNGVEPPTQVIDSSEPLAANMSSYKQPREGEHDPSVIFMNRPGWYHNWWALAWHFEGDADTECNVHTTMVPDVLGSVLDHVGHAALKLGVTTGTVVLGVPGDLSAAFNATTQAATTFVHNEIVPTGQSTPALELFGSNLLQELGKSSSTHGFNQCDLQVQDFENRKGGDPLRIEIGDAHVEILVGGGLHKCKLAIADLSRLNTEECLGTAKSEAGALEEDVKLSDPQLDDGWC